MLVYLLNDNKLFRSEKMTTSRPHDKFKSVLKAKKKSCVVSLCINSAKFLRPFAARIFALKFDQKPNYNSLRGVLEDMIAEESIEFSSMTVHIPFKPCIDNFDDLVIKQYEM